MFWKFKLNDSNWAYYQFIKSRGLHNFNQSKLQTKVRKWQTKNQVQVTYGVGNQGCNASSKCFSQNLPNPSFSQIGQVCVEDITNHYTTLFKSKFKGKAVYTGIQTTFQLLPSIKQMNPENTCQFPSKRYYKLPEGLYLSSNIIHLYGLTNWLRYYNCNKNTKWLQNYNHYSIPACSGNLSFMSQIELVTIL